MRMDYLLNQSSAGEAAPAPLRYGALIQVAPINARRPSFDGLTISVHWATAFLVLALFASAWLHALAEAQHSYQSAQLRQHRGPAKSQ
jgi:hypothetical protein